MSFADELRSSSHLSDDERWKECCQIAVQCMKKDVKNACRQAAARGANSAYVSFTFDNYHHKGLYPAYDFETSLFGKKREHPRYTILKEVIFSEFVPYLNVLGLKYGGISTKRKPDSYYWGNDYQVSIGVNW